ncbi:MAG TPA: TonB-dependent receptor [Chitinophagales bacterium]|nr:TonB-dependent receptor [Chitinophagales bacterium]
MKKVFFFLLIAKMSFGQSDSTQVDSLRNKLKEITLSDAVIVSSTRASGLAPVASQLITKAELSKNNLGQDVPFLLDQTPSAVITSDAGAGIGYTGIRIRGSDNTRINVTLNGIPVNDAEDQGVYWVDIPDVVSSTQSIQIQRGVGTSTNGPGAFGGTISIQTQSPSVDPYGEADVSGGSFGAFKITGKAGTGLIKKHFFADASGSYITSNGYIDRAWSHLQSYFAQAGYINDKTLLKFVYFGGREHTYQAWDGVLQDSLATNRTYNDLGTDYGQHSPPYANQTDNYKQDYFQLLFAQQLPMGFHLNAGLFATLGQGYYEEYKVGQDYNAYFPGYDTVPAVTDLIRQKWLKNYFYGGTFALDYNYRAFTATLGGILSQFKGENFGKVIWAQDITGVDPGRYYYDGHGAKNDYTVYAKFNYYLLHKINFYADLQYRYVHYTTNGIDDNLLSYNFTNTWNFFNPKAGVTFDINSRHHLYASFAMAHREPNRDDILAAPPGLQPVPEVLRDVEVGYRSFFNAGNNVQVLLNPGFYYMNYKNQLVLTGQLNDVGASIRQNVPNSFRTGIEILGGFAFWYRLPHQYGELETLRKVFAINYTFTYSINKIQSFNEYVYTYDDNYVSIDSLTQIINHKNTYIAFSPDIVASLELVAYPVRGLSISVMSKAISKQYLDNTSSETRLLKPFYYTNINISYSLPLQKPGKEIILKLLLNNIFNHLYESNGYTYTERYASPDGNGGLAVSPAATYNYYSPQAGFNVLAGVTVKF